MIGVPAWRASCLEGPPQNPNVICELFVEGA